MGDDKTIFKGKIGIEVNLIVDDGNKWIHKSTMSIPGKYFDNLDCRNIEGSEWFEMNDFGEISVPDGYYVDRHPVGRVGIGNARYIRDPYVNRIMREYVMEEIYKNHPRTFHTRDTSLQNIKRSPYFEWNDLPEFSNFYIYPNSPADKWISGNQNKPYDHIAPDEFGVSFTLIRTNTELLQGGNPKVRFAGMIFDGEDNEIEDLEAFYLTDTEDFGAPLSTYDFELLRRSEMVPGLPTRPDGSQPPLYVYRGSRLRDFQDYIVRNIQSKVGRSYRIDLAGSDAELNVLPDSELETWIFEKDNSVLAPSPFMLQVRLVATKVEGGFEEEEVGVGGLRGQYQYEEKGMYRGEGIAPRSAGDEEMFEEIEKAVDEIIENYAPTLDKKQQPYKIKDTDLDGDYDEFDKIYEGGDLFGTKQGERKPFQAKTAMEFQEGAPPDLYRPFDEFDNEYHEVKREIDNSKIVSKRELTEFNLYCEEAYLDEREFDEKMVREPYPDGRKDSFLVVVGNAEARIYEYTTRNNERRLVIAFRGTTPPSLSKPLTDTAKFIRDATTDLSAKTQNLTYIGITNPDPETKGIVHQGFADYCNALYDQLTAIVKWNISTYGDVKVYICGHSLGGIASVVYAYMLSQRENILPTRIYQFGAPMGIWTFGDVISKTLPIINVFHTHDIIPPVSALFSQHGTKLVFDLKGNLTPYPVGMEVPDYDYQRYKGERLLFALRKNGAYKEGTTLEEQAISLKEPGAPNPLRDDEYDSIINKSSFLNFLSNVGELFSSYKNPAQREAFIHIGKILGESGLNFYHTRYKQTIDEMKEKSIQIDTFRYFSKLFEHDPNPRSHHETHDKTYTGSLGKHHLYQDAGGNLFFSTEDPNNINFHPIDRTEPLGMIFYDKNMNIDNKAIVFYS